MSRPSYRSVLTLLLFAYTEMPVDTDDNGFNHLCNEVFFSHINYLRSPFQQGSIRPLTDYTTAIPLIHTSLNSPLPQPRAKASEKQEYMRDSMFWLGVICDCTRSLVIQCSSVILPGKAGNATVWELIRQRTVIFDQSFRRFHGSALSLSPDITPIILQHASACKTMYLGMLNQFCDAVYQNAELDQAAQAVSIESCRFHDVFDPLLDICRRDYLSMSAECQLSYGKLQLLPQHCSVADKS
jgi:hypothetical protein